MKIERPNLLHPKARKPFTRTVFVPNNFKQVDSGGFLMRSAQPTPKELKYLIDNYNLTAIVNLSNNSPEATLALEKEAAANYHLEYFSIPSETDFPQKSNIEKFLELTQRLKREKPNSKLLVHCNAGVDRTGTYVLFYQLFNKLKSLEEALKEMIDMGHWPEVHPKLIPNIKRLVKEMKL